MTAADVRPAGRVRLTCDPATAARIAGHAVDAADARLLLEALGLIEDVPAPVVVPAHERHTRSHYVPGCRKCRRVHAAYVRAWRARRRVTSGPTVTYVVLAAPDRRHRAWPGQYALHIEGAAR